MGFIPEIQGWLNHKKINQCNISLKKADRLQSVISIDAENRFGQSSLLTYKNAEDTRNSRKLP